MPSFSRLEAEAGRQRLVQVWHRPPGPEDRPSGGEARCPLGTVLPLGGQAGWASPARATASHHSRWRAEQAAHLSQVWSHLGPQPLPGNSGFHFTGEERDV